MSKLLWLIAALQGAVWSCAEVPAEKPSASSSSGAVHSALETCVASFSRQRDCTDAFIPALVDLRVRTDVPAGIAETARTGGRDALIAEAHDEWKKDSSDEAINDTCSRMAGRVDEAMLRSMSACLSHASCAEFVPCEIVVLEHRLARR
jgi:hypothetical protein